MAFLTKKHLSRRTFLNGVGVTIALPFLESMVPAGTPLAQTAATGRTRLGCIYIPHGATMDKWTPAAAGKSFELTEILQPLAPFAAKTLLAEGPEFETTIDRVSALLTTPVMRRLNAARPAFRPSSLPA